MTFRDDITQAKQQKLTGDIIALVIRSTWPVGPNYEAWRSHNWTGSLLLLRVCLKIGNYFPGLWTIRMSPYCFWCWTVCVSVVSGDIYCGVCRHDNDCCGREFNRHLDCSRTQAHAHCYQLFPGEPGGCRRAHYRLQHDIQLYLLAVQRLAVWSSLLQVHSVHLAVHNDCQRPHLRRYRCRQVKCSVVTNNSNKLIVDKNFTGKFQLPPEPYYGGKTSQSHYSISP